MAKLYEDILRINAFDGHVIKVEDNPRRPIYRGATVDLVLLDENRNPIDSKYDGNVTINFHFNGITHTDAVNPIDVATLKTVDPLYVAPTFEGFCTGVSLTENAPIAEQADFDPLVDTEAVYVRVSIERFNRD